MKRASYLAAFTVLGILAQFLVHAGIEIWYIGRLLEDFSRYSFGFSWGEWLMIHHVGAVILVVAGALAGFRQGKYWWRKIYQEHLLKRWFPRIAP